MSDDVSAPRLTYAAIATTSYSGATLLAMLLGRHPDIVTVGELDGIIPEEDPDGYRCSCGELIGRCEFWGRVAESLAGDGIPFDVARFGMSYEPSGPGPVRRLMIMSFGHPALDRLRDRVVEVWPPERRARRELAARNAAFVRAILGVRAAHVLVDSSKDPLRFAVLDRSSDLDVRVIHLVRDARGVVASRLRRGGGIDEGTAARQWARQHTRIERRLATFPRDRQLRVRYEDLCRHPAAVVDAIERFLGVEPEPVVWPLLPVEQHVVGNAIRLEAIAGISLDERWRSLSPRQLAAIDAGGGGVRRRYGYEEAAS
jgi:hypothetical protein